MIYRLYHSCVYYWKTYPLIGALCVWSVAMMAFTIMIAGPTFADPDSFYHIKLTEIIWHHKAAVTEFPWLAFTSLTQSYVDHHFLYHVFLIPWVVLFGGVLGGKIATVILAASTIALAYLALRHYRVPGAMLFALLLLCNPDFAFRMSLTKATTVGCLFMVTGLILLLKRNYRALLLLAFAFVWSYGGFLLLAILAGVTSCVRILFVRVHAKRFVSKKALLLCILPLLSVAAGTLAGLLIHPSFPNHFRFYWEQIIQIGFVNYSNVIGVGGEWYPYNPIDLAGSMIVITILYAFSLCVALWHARKLKEGSWITLIMSLFFLAFTLKSRRYVEYCVPWAILASAYILTDTGILASCMRTVRTTLLGWGRAPVLTRVMIAISALSITYGVSTQSVNTIDTVHGYLQGGFPTTQFAQAGAWLQAHATPGDIVFHDDWSTFPLLFYNSAKPYYIVGLDPTFMYRYNTDLYWKWANITLNRYDGELYPVIAEDFHARFVFVDSKHLALKAQLLADNRFVQVYQDAEATIFRVPRK